MANQTSPRLPLPPLTPELLDALLDHLPLPPDAESPAHTPSAQWAAVLASTQDRAAVLALEEAVDARAEARLRAGVALGYALGQAAGAVGASGGPEERLAVEVAAMVLRSELHGSDAVTVATRALGTLRDRWGSGE